MPPNTEIRYPEEKIGFSFRYHFYFIDIVVRLFLLLCYLCCWLRARWTGVSHHIKAPEQNGIQTRKERNPWDNDFEPCTLLYRLYSQRI